MKHDLRTRTFIVFAAITSVFVLARQLFGVENIFEMFGMLIRDPLGFFPFVFHRFINFFYDIFIGMDYRGALVLTFLGLNIAAAILLYKNTKKTKTIGWAFAIIPALAMMFTRFFQVVSQEDIISTISTLAAGGISWGIIGLAQALVPLLIIIIAITELAKVKNKTADLILGAALIGVFCLAHLIEVIINFTPDFRYWLNELIRINLFIFTLVVWSRFEK